MEKTFIFRCRNPECGDTVVEKRTFLDGIILSPAKQETLEKELGKENVAGARFDSEVCPNCSDMPQRRGRLHILHTRAKCCPA